VSAWVTEWGQERCISVHQPLPHSLTQAHPLPHSLPHCLTPSLSRFFLPSS
jgi:hypothetical protein